MSEVDWHWNWEDPAKPRSGRFKVNILDVVKCASAYGTRGDGTYNPLHLPNADLDANDLCHIGILDLATITSKYGQTFRPATIICHSRTIIAGDHTDVCTIVTVGKFH